MRLVYGCAVFDGAVYLTDEERPRPNERLFVEVANGSDRANAKLSREDVVVLRDALTSVIDRWKTEES